MWKTRWDPKRKDSIQSFRTWKWLAQTVMHVAIHTHRSKRRDIFTIFFMHGLKPNLLYKWHQKNFKIYNNGRVTYYDWHFVFNYWNDCGSCVHCSVAMIANIEAYFALDSSRHYLWHPRFIASLHIPGKKQYPHRLKFGNEGLCRVLAFVISTTNCSRHHLRHVVMSGNKG